MRHLQKTTGGLEGAKIRGGGRRPRTPPTHTHTHWIRFCFEGACVSRCNYKRNTCVVFQGRSPYDLTHAQHNPLGRLGKHETLTYELTLERKHSISLLRDKYHSNYIPALVVLRTFCHFSISEQIITIPETTSCFMYPRKTNIILSVQM